MGGEHQPFRLLKVFIIVMEVCMLHGIRILLFVVEHDMCVAFQLDVARSQTFLGRRDERL